MPFKKGQSGNPNGRPKKGQSWADVLKRLCDEEIDFKGEKLTKMEAIGRKLLSEAIQGEQWAINALMDRIDGKPKQVVDQTVKTVAVNIDSEEADSVV